MRRHAQTWLIKALLWVLIAVFAFWGVGSGLGMFGHVKPVATIDGHKILPDQVDQQAELFRRRIEAAYGANADKLLAAFNVRQEALEELIDSVLIGREAKRLGLRISNSVLMDRIASDPAFQDRGRFNFALYKRTLRANNLLPADFEQMQRTAMLSDLMHQMMAQAVVVSDSEAHQQFDLNHQALSLSYVKVPFSDFTGQVQPTAKQVEEFYKKNREQFRRPQQLQIAYIDYDPSSLAGQYLPTDSQVSRYYHENLKRLFTHSKEFRARHILISCPADATSQEQAAAKKKAEKIMAQLRAGASFAKLAKEYSDDPGTKQAGGELGFFSSGQLVKPFEDEVQKLKPGQIGIARSQFGYHVIQLEEVRPASVESLDQAKKKIVSALRDQEGQRLAHEYLDHDLSVALSGSDLKAIATKRSLKVVKTPLFDADKAVPGTDDDAQLSGEVVKLKPSDIQALTTRKGSYLVKVLAKKPSSIPSFSEVKDHVRQALLDQTARNEARAQAQALLGQARKEGSLSKAASAMGLTVQETGVFGRDTREVPGIGNFPQVTDAAALVPSVPGLINHVIEHDDSLYVFEVTSRVIPSEEDWKKAATASSRTLGATVREQLWPGFLDSLKSRATISVNPNELGGPGSGPV